MKFHWPYLLAAGLLGRSALACQCGVIPTAVEATGLASTVFAGTVTEVREAELTVETSTGVRTVSVKEYVFRVQKVWKGERVAEVSLVSGLSNCDVSFQVGNAYLVFAEPGAGRADRLVASRCLPTKPYRRAAKDISALDGAKRAHR